MKHMQNYGDPHKVVDHTYIALVITAILIVASWVIGFVLIFF
jgi:general stress protein CsbA